jgi:carbonic anhydrase/acetyltransferase-like protein (isoleucine patch superfamily)
MSPAAPSPIILPYRGTRPAIADGVFVAPGAVVVGDVTVEPGASIWFGCVLRGDERAIRIGANTNVQDLTLIHTSRGGPDAQIGAEVTVGHSAVLHGCLVHDRVLIGMGAIVLDGAEIESGAVIAAGAVITPGRRVRAGELWAGCPAKHVGEASERHAEFIRSTPPHYRTKAAAYLDVLEGRG